MLFRKNGLMPGDQQEGFRQLLLDAVAGHNILPLTSSCNLHCLFCSHLRMPPQLDVFTFPPLPQAELQELIPFLDSNSKIIIGESSTRLCEGEPFTHPHILPLLYSLRERFPQTPLQITTNGTLLTPKTIMALGHLGGNTPDGDPLLELIISLNCSKPAVRRDILGDRDPQRVIDSLQHCFDYGIPFHGSVVAVPHLAGWDDLEHTLRFLDNNGARTIRIFLPGTTRFAPAAQRGDASLWGEIAAFRKRVKGSVRCPVLLEPPLKQDLVARVEGVMGGTAAQQAGLQDGDIITAVDGETVSSGVMAFGRIKNAVNPTLTVARIMDRKNTALTLRLEKARGASSGIIMTYDLAEEIIDTVASEISRCKATAPLLLTSPLAAPLWNEARLCGLIPGQTRISIVANKFFGGTICCAGLLTVSDLRNHLSSLATNDEADLFLIPATPFDKRGRDLRGENYRQLFQTFPHLCLTVLPQ